MTESESHLRNSDAYQSLVSEMRVASTLRRLGWSTIHSATYADALDPSKLRELDVVATRSWIRERKGTETYVRLHLFIECKGLRGKDVLFARHAAQSKGDRLYYHWSGLDDDALRDSLHARLGDAGYATDVVRLIMERFGEMTYPDGRAAVHNLLPNAPRAPFRASAERQPNRDPGTDPLWQATSTVFDAMAGTTRELLVDALTDLDDALRFRSRPEDDTADYALSSLQNASSTVTLFHPIVVTEATLHGVATNGATSSIDWCRLEQERIATGEQRWIDICAATAFDALAATLTKWYDQRFTRAGCTPAGVSAS